MLNERELLLERVKNSMATRVCKAYNYDKIGKPTSEIYYEIILLRNYEFYLCGSEIEDCDVLSCIKCAIEKYLN